MNQTATVEPTTVTAPTTTPTMPVQPAASATPVTPLVTPEAKPAKTEDSLLGTEEPKTEGETTEPKTETPKAVIEKYEVKLPEGQEVDIELVTALTPTLQKLGISNEALQELATVYAPYVKQMADKQVQAYQQQQEQAFNEVRAELKTEAMKKLGDNAKRELSIAGRALEKWGSKGLREKLIAVGLDNDIEMIEFCANAGRTITPDSFAEPAKTGGEPSRDQVLDTMYPSMKKK